MTDAPDVPAEVMAAIEDAIKAFGQAQYDYGHGDWESRGRAVNVIVQTHAALVAAIAQALAAARQDGARNLLQEWE